MTDYIFRSSLHTVKVSLSSFIACLSTQYTGASERTNERNEYDCDMTKRIWACHWPLLFIYGTFGCARMCVDVKKCVCVGERGELVIKRERERNKDEKRVFWIPRSRGVCKAQHAVHMQCCCRSVCVCPSQTNSRHIKQALLCWMLWTHSHRTIHSSLCVCVCKRTGESSVRMCLPCEMCNFFTIQIFIKWISSSITMAEDIYTHYIIYATCKLQ